MQVLKNRKGKLSKTIVKKCNCGTIKLGEEYEVEVCSNWSNNICYNSYSKCLSIHPSNYQS